MTIKSDALLRGDRDDQARAAIFDEWIAAQAPAIRADVEYWLCQLVTNGPLSETGAKAWLVMLIIYACDVREVLGLEWDLMIAHPPCTRLANSGVRWLHERDLWDDMREAAEFFRELLDADIPKVAAENPIPHRYALEIIGRKYDQIIQPWQFGHGETKATCLWLRGLPPLRPTNEVAGREQRIWRMPPGPERSRERSVTYPGIAAAMAAQWGEA